MAHYAFNLVEELCLQSASTGAYAADSNSGFSAVSGCYFVLRNFFLVGIWHGRTSEFVVFGVVRGGGVTNQQDVANLVGRQNWAEGIQEIGFEWYLYCFWPWLDLHLVRLHALLVLGQLEAGRSSFRGYRSVSMGRSMADGLAERNARIDTLGATYTALLSIRTSGSGALSAMHA